MLKDFTKENFDIIIQAGQSNSEGYGFGPTDEPYQPSDRVWYLRPNMTISVAVEKVTGNGIQSSFGLSFAREYMNSGRLAEGRSILIIRAAVGGTGFLDNRWKLTDDLYLKMMDMIETALSLNPENRLVALLWHQGETDAMLGATYDGHYANLSALVKSVRDTFDQPSLPFIAGDFVPHWRDANAEIATPVSNAVRAVCQDLDHGGFVESDGLKSNLQGDFEHPLGWRHDAIHFSRASVYELGKRYYAKFCEIIEK